MRSYINWNWRFQMVILQGDRWNIDSTYPHLCIHTFFWFIIAIIMITMFVLHPLVQNVAWRHSLSTPKVSVICFIYCIEISAFMNSRKKWNSNFFNTRKFCNENFTFSLRKMFICRYKFKSFGKLCNQLQVYISMVFKVKYLNLYSES